MPDPVTVGLIVSNILSYLIHFFHFNSKCKIRSACCEVDSALTENTEAIANLNNGTNRLSRGNSTIFPQITR